MKSWYPCELHCHTLHSDGSFSVDELLSAAKQRRLSGICLTDHNTISGWTETEKETELAVLKGIEYTTYHGHMLCLGTDEIIDFTTISNIDCTVKSFRDSGGLVGIAHPFQLGTPICTGGHWDYNITRWENVNYIEVFSEGCPYLNTPNKKARALWHSLLDKGYRIAPSMGRDWHRLNGNIILAACTYLLCDEGKLTADKMKKAINEGRTAITTGPLFAFATKDGKSVGDEITKGENTLEIILDTERQKKITPGQSFCFKEIRLVSNGGKTVKAIPATQKSVTFDFINGQWYSLELWGDIDEKTDTLLAFTGAVYCKEENI